MDVKRKKINKRNLINDYQPWIATALKQHIKAGYSARSFSGYYNIATAKYEKWLRDIPEMKAVNDEYKEMLKDKWKKTRSFVWKVENESQD